MNVCRRSLEEAGVFCVDFSITICYLPAIYQGLARNRQNFPTHKTQDEEPYITLERHLLLNCSKESLVRARKRVWPLLIQLSERLQPLLITKCPKHCGDNKLAKRLSHLLIKNCTAPGRCFDRGVAITPGCTELAVTGAPSACEDKFGMSLRKSIAYITQTMATFQGTILPVLYKHHSFPLRQLTSVLAQKDSGVSVLFAETKGF